MNIEGVLDYIAEMYTNTDANGVLYVPGLDKYGTESETESQRCRLNWTYDDYESLCRYFRKQAENLIILAEYYKDHEYRSEPAKYRGNDSVYNTWNTYVRPLKVSDTEWDVIYEIEERIEMIDDMKALAQKVIDGSEISKNEKEFYADYMDTSVSSNERKLVRDYYDAKISDAETRAGSNIGAYNEVIRGSRLCRLMSLGAPEVIIDNELKWFAIDMVIHRHGISVEDASIEVLRRLESMDSLSDEELDEMFAEKKMNSRKGLLPLLVYLLLKDNTNSRKRMRQQEILERLKEDPYGVTVERKALSRTLHSLEAMDIGIHSEGGKGVWFE